jgi:hypothetical protein
MFPTSLGIFRDELEEEEQNIYLYIILSNYSSVVGIYTTTYLTKTKVNNFKL